jgi:arginase
MRKTVTAIGIEVGIGAGKPGTRKAPTTIKQSAFLPDSVTWKETIAAREVHSAKEKLFSIYDANCKLAESVSDAVKSKQFFMVMGGDHSCAMGTWSGVSHALEADFGLIWIDAHCDAHTHDSTHTGNIHGMPVAALMGYGEEHLTQIAHPKQKLKPENLAMIGIRDYETEEHELLKSLGVKIFYNTDVAELGMDKVMQEAIKHVKKNTQHYGLSFDLDGVDPSEIPAVGTPVPNGIGAADCLKSLEQLAGDPQLVGYEIVEYNPDLDPDQFTEKYVCQVIDTIQPETDHQKSPHTAIEEPA